MNLLRVLSYLRLLQRTTFAVIEVVSPLTVFFELRIELYLQALEILSIARASSQYHSGWSATSNSRLYLMFKGGGVETGGQSGVYKDSNVD